MSFGKRLKEIRTATGKSQTTVADELCERYPNARVSQSAYSAWEHRSSAPRGDVLEMLCDYFGVHIADLLPLTSAPYNLRDDVYDIAELIAILVTVEGDGVSAKNARSALIEVITERLNQLDVKLATVDTARYDWVMARIENAHANGEAG